jgi:DNA-directed RNA polymerase subunit L
MSELPIPPPAFVKSDVVNDMIDYDNVRVKVSLDDPEVEEELRIRLKGKCIDYSIANAIRRTIGEDIPIYAFPNSLIEIDHKRSLSMYNNDMIKGQIEMLPIFDVGNPFDLENPELYLPTEVMKSIFAELLPEKETKEDESEDRKETKKLSHIELHISFKNRTDEKHYLGTHDAVLKINGKVSDSYLKRDNIHILVLKPGEEMHLRAVANLATAEFHAAYEATSNPIHEMIADDEYVINFETLGQLDKYTIFDKALYILIKKLENINAYMISKYPKEPNEKKISIELVGQNSTIGSLYSTALKKSPHTSSGTFSIPHPMNRSVIISYTMAPKSKVKPIALFTMTTEYLIKIFKKIASAKYERN